MKSATLWGYSLALIGALAVGTSPRAAAAPAGHDIELTVLGTYNSGAGEFGAEIPAYDPVSKRVFVSNAAYQRVDIIDVSDPATPVLWGTIDLTSYGEEPTSVAFKNGLGAVAVKADPVTDPGKVVLFNADGAVWGSLVVGSLPDMVTFTPNGTRLLVANEGEPSKDYSIDPVGSITIIDLRGGLDAATVCFAGFEAWVGEDALAVPAGVRIYGPGATVAQDLEPEYIAVSQDSQTGWVTLQENNALAVVDINNCEVTELIPLGVKDHSVAGNGLDASDRDSAINIRTWPVYGMYQPDSIGAYEVGGQTFLVMANEGDAREYDVIEEESRVKDVALDPTAFPNAADLQKNGKLGRLGVTTYNGDIDGDEDFDVLYSFGARSFSIRTADGALVFDSGDEIEQITAAALPANFNANNDSNALDNRSDNKGPEPEGLALGKAYGRTYAFVGLERIGGVVVYDISNPAEPEFTQYINNRDFSQGEPAGDLGPEGLLFIKAEDSPTGKPMLVVANEVSGTTTLYSVDKLANKK